jgi:hypothetical protein
MCRNTVVNTLDLRRKHGYQNWITPCEAPKLCLIGVLCDFLLLLFTRAVRLSCIFPCFFCLVLAYRANVGGVELVFYTPILMENCKWVVLREHSRISTTILVPPMPFTRNSSVWEVMGQCFVWHVNRNATKIW